MRKALITFLSVALISTILFTGCSISSLLYDEKKIPSDQSKTQQPEVTYETGEVETPNKQDETGTNEGSSVSTAVTEEKPPVPQINLSEVKPNENGKIMVVMFHNFIEKYESGDKEYTTTFSEFRKLLQKLYDMDYRLISLSDFINNDISVPAGCIPLVFTFDDGTSGQLNLEKTDGKLTANKQSAVGIMEEFYAEHPDFGLEGTFFVNLNLGTFRGDGTVEEGLKYLIDKGFEIGNHTFNHVYLNDIKDAATIQKEIGSNKNKMEDIVPGYEMNLFSLPYGLPSKELVGYVEKGSYEGKDYKNIAIMEVGWDPSVSPISKNFNPLTFHRVRASGIEAVDCDLEWWLERLSRQEQYVSDGNPDTITIPKDGEASIDMNKIVNKELIVY